MLSGCPLRRGLVLLAVLASVGGVVLRAGSFEAAIGRQLSSSIEKTQWLSASI